MSSIGCTKSYVGWAEPSLRPIIEWATVTGSRSTKPAAADRESGLVEAMPSRRSHDSPEDPTLVAHAFLPSDLREKGIGLFPGLIEPLQIDAEPIQLDFAIVVDVKKEAWQLFPQPIAKVRFRTL